MTPEVGGALMQGACKEHIFPGLRYPPPKNHPSSERLAEVRNLQVKQLKQLVICLVAYKRKFPLSSNTALGGGAVSAVAISFSTASRLSKEAHTQATWEHFKYERSLTAGMGAAPLDSKPSRGLFLSGRFHWHFNACRRLQLDL
eukprot:1153127-Pelagomonas_calceolata.AAC.3